MAETGGGWRWLIAGELRAFPMRFLLAGLAIAIGVALAFAVHVINRSAADAFGQAVRSVSGGSDLQISGASALGFDETLYPRLMALEIVADASPVVQLRAMIGEQNKPITLLGLDMLRALTVSPNLIGRTSAEAGEAEAALDMDALYLSETARAQNGLRIGGRVDVRANGRSHSFTITGDLPGVDAGQAIGVIDIATAQWRFGRLGMLDRIDLKLAQGVSIEAARRAVETVLPGSARLTDAEAESRRGDTLSRAYRVNLDMLALVALLTGGFLVYSAQSLSVTRRLRQFALLRTLGMQKRALGAQLLGEGALLGIAGSLLGLAGGYAIAGAALRFVGGDLGAGYFGGTSPKLHFAPMAALLFLSFGIATAVAGSYVPARQAARIAPAQTLKDAGDPVDPRAAPKAWPAMALIALATLFAFLPAVNRLPLFGYLAVALMLAGCVAGMPWLARTLLRPLARADSRLPSLDLALHRLLGAPSQASTALGGIVASTGLMIAMAVMVTSFRGSVDDWLASFLSADLYVAAASNEASFDAETQRRLADTPGVAGIAFSKSLSMTLDPELPPVLLLVRPVAGPGYELPLIEKARRPGVGLALWLSEPAARLYGARPGAPISLPIGKEGEPARAYVAGIWRDYARQQGAIIIDARDYIALTGDEMRSEAAVDIAPGASVPAVRAAIEARLPPDLAGRVSFAEPASLRARALALFDRSFAITYVLEAIAILIGLAGVAATISAQTIARIKEFGMLRHVGMTAGQILAMLASEGALLGFIGVTAGITVGLALSQILIHVINPQSFNWTMATTIPWALILAVVAALIITAAGTAVIAGRRAVSRDAVRAVREDW
ncbi:ABC transporter permease [Sphingomonas oleivorans]|uniref:ABC transporter permease n=1 Tax=Sphingomonas oleivorans TaxID=1735121 RepID=A0A2T5G230_9SPHN|nr:FtsX-like permease family protein [Sphingomonas oleivorans]PTQ13186.1 ABC transporter permease [Sphingomonas oleivorans]